MVHITGPELTEAREKYLGKTVYSYMLQNDEIILRKKEITNLQIKSDIDDNGKRSGEYIQVAIGKCYFLPLSSIGDTHSFTSEWFSFTQDDNQARQILYGYHSAAMNRAMSQLIEKMNYYKKDYDEIFKTIASGEIKKDKSFLEESEQNENVGIELE